LNVVFATEYYPPFAPGGAQWRLRNLARALVQAGHRVAVVTPDYGAPRRESSDGVEVRRFPFPVKIAPGQGWVSDGWFWAPPMVLYYAWQIRRVVKELDADVLHAFLPRSVIPTWLAARTSGATCVAEFVDAGYGCPITTCLIEGPEIPKDCGQARLWRHCSRFYHGQYVSRSGRGLTWLRAKLALLFADARLRLAVLRRFDGLVFLSRGLQEIYLKSGQIPTDGPMMTVRPPTANAWPATVETERRVLQSRYGVEGRKVVLYAGKASLGKGTGLLMQAAELVADEVPDVTFLLAGKGMVPPSTGRADIRSLGVVPHERMAELYTLADIVAHPAIYPEAFGQNLFDGAYFGKPCVASATGGTGDIVKDGETGFLVPRGDPEAFARALVKLLKSEELRRTLGARGAAFVREEFAPARVIGEVERFYARCLSGRRGR